MEAIRRLPCHAGRRLRLGFCFAALGTAGLAGCSEIQLITHGAKRLSAPKPTLITPAPDIKQPGNLGNYKIGKPYQIKGIWYYPKVDYTYSETGIASWYGPKFHGRKTANGETFDQWAVSAAHRTLPMPSWVRVTNLDNGKSMELRVNDRGPFARGRIIDLSRRAAQLLGLEIQGTARVKVEILSAESRRLAALAGTGGIERSPLVRTVPRAVIGTAPVTAVTGPEPVVRVAARPMRRVLEIPSSGPVLEGGRVLSSIWIQAGAFSRYDNAIKLMDRLSPFGQSVIAKVERESGVLWRVRIGPMQTVAEADILLDQVIDAGHPEARVIVDCRGGSC